AALDLAADVTPLAATFVAVAPVAPFAGEEGAVVLPVPVPPAAEAEAAVEVLRKNERTFAGASLRGHPVEHVAGALTLERAVDDDVPSLVQCRLRLRLGGKVDKAVARDEPSRNRPAPRRGDVHELDGPGAAAHVPEVRRAALEAGLGPRRPDA